MSAHDWAPGELDAEAAAREERYAHVELEAWEREQLADRLGRDDPVRTRCAVYASARPTKEMRASSPVHGKKRRPPIEEEV